MTREEFDKLVQQVESGVGRDARALYRRILCWTILGYAGLVAPLGMVLAFSLAFIIPGVLWPQDAVFALVIGALILTVGGWAAGRVLWVRLSPPEGREVLREEAPVLFQALDELCRKLKSVPFHQVLILPNCNAGVVQRPRLGIFGWQKNYLLLGLPLMEGLSKEELVAVLAHECAHLSKEHHRSGQWIYRLRRSWEQVFEKLSRPRGSGEISLRPLIGKFVQWFWPRFNAYAFVLSRAHEYQADAVAAELGGKDHAATALIRIGWYMRVLDEKFWPDLWQLTKSSDVPPEGVFLRLKQSLSAINHSSDGKWLEQAFRSTTTNADTHPCLSDRLRAIGWNCGAGASDVASALPAPRPNAAEALLGSALGKIREEVEQAWRKKCEQQWRQQHGKANILHARLGQIDGTIVVKKEDTDALWDKVRVLLGLQDTQAAVPLLRQLLVLDPKHVAGNFNLGIHLLNSGEAEGEVYLERAIAEDEELLPQASDAFHNYYRQSGQSERLREFYARLDRHEKAIAASRAERSNITAADTFIPHDLSQAELTALRETLAANPEIIAADLGRKELRHFARQKLFLLCIRIRPAWHRMPSGSRQQEVVNQLVKQARLPGRVLIFAPSGNFRRIARKLATVSGARVFSRSE
jgi:Zn-dependent protease with chaperone function